MLPGARCLYITILIRSRLWRTITRLGSMSGTMSSMSMTMTIVMTVTMSMTNLVTLLQSCWPAMFVLGLTQARIL